MGRQLILKDNGDIVVFSTIVDDFVFEGSIEEYIKIRIEDSSEKIKDDLNDIYKGLKNGTYEPITYKEACEIRDEAKKYNNE